jgi:2-keto-4-pentenoate hydratase/2-oxohepta-3-ene-1,7-dioic acid hydratase in catechol pathway
MRLLTFRVDGDERLGFSLGNGKILDAAKAFAERAERDVPSEALAGVVQFIEHAEKARPVVQQLLATPPANAILSETSVHICAPIPLPRRNVFCVGRNYIEHVAEGDRAAKKETSRPEWPTFFTKPPQAVIGPGEKIPAHSSVSEKMDYEVELAIVIGKAGMNISEARAMDHVFGSTIANDITARDVQRRHVQWFKGKGLDRSCPLGPTIVTVDELDPTDLELSLTLNGERRQVNRTSNMIFNIPTIINQLSAGMQLLPGDVILTGTPEGVGYAMEPAQFLKAGDRIVARIEGIGELENTFG